MRSAINELVRRHEALAQILTSAEETIRARQSELQVIDADLAALLVTTPPSALPEALTAARDLGNISAVSYTHLTLPTSNLV